LKSIQFGLKAAKRSRYVLCCTYL